MDFTGERFIRDIGLEAEIEIEHLQRYYSVLELVKGKVVLDAAAGSGYGSRILAEQAAVVHGLEIDLEAIDFSREKYSAPNCYFNCGSIANLPFADNSFDVIVSFETIEHVEESIQSAFLSEARRVLKGDGLLIISTPEKLTYSDKPGYRNEYHKKEFYKDEFLAFLRTSFANVTFFNQFISLAYLLTRDQDEHLRLLKIQAVKNPAKYLIAICRQSDDDVDWPLGSIVIDQQETHQQKIQRIFDLQDENAEKNRVIDTAYGLVGERDEEIRELREQGRGLTKQISHLETEKERQVELSLKAESEIESLSQRLSQCQEEVAQQTEKLAAAEAALADIYRTKGWRLVQKMYWLKDKLSFF